MTWQVAGLGQKVHREQLDSGLPDDLAAEFYSLGWEETYAISASHGRGTGDLLDAIHFRRRCAPAWRS